MKKSYIFFLVILFCLIAIGSFLAGAFYHEKNLENEYVKFIPYQINTNELGVNYEKKEDLLDNRSFRHWLIENFEFNNQDYRVIDEVIYVRKRFMNDFELVSNFTSKAISRSAPKLEFKKFSSDDEQKAYLKEKYPDENIKFN
jgi:hypothetical protein